MMKLYPGIVFYFVSKALYYDVLAKWIPCCLSVSVLRTCTLYIVLLFVRCYTASMSFCFVSCHLLYYVLSFQSQSVIFVCIDSQWPHSTHSYGASVVAGATKHRCKFIL